MRKRIEFYINAYGEFKKLDRGQSTRELGRILGVDPKTIFEWRRGRTPITKYSPTQKDILVQAEHMLNEGYSYTSVAEYLSIRHETLAKHFPGMGQGSGPRKKLDYGLDSYV